MSHTKGGNGVNTLAQAKQPQPRRLMSFPLMQHFGSLPLIQATRRAISSFPLNPIFTPRATFARWCTHRAMRLATREAREKDIQRDWQKKFKLNGLTWHHQYISQDLHTISQFLCDLERNDNRGGSRGGGGGKGKHMIMPLPLQVSGMTVVQLERSFAFLLDNVYDVYNSLEKHVLFPWIIGGVTHTQSGNAIAIKKAMNLFSKERDRIEDRADIIRSRFARLVCTTGFPYTSMGPCANSRTFSQTASRQRRERRKGESLDSKAQSKALKEKNSHQLSSDKDVSRRRRSSLYIRAGYLPSPESSDEQSLKGLGKKKIEDSLTVRESRVKKWNCIDMNELKGLSMDLSNMIEDSDRLHKTERSLLFPIIAKCFGDTEQDRLTNVIVYSMRSALAKLLVTVYHQSVEKQGSRSQWKWYKREVPLPIRVYTPVWRARLYDGSPLGWLRNTCMKDIRKQSAILKQQQQ